MNGRLILIALFIATRSAAGNYPLMPQAGQDSLLIAWMNESNPDSIRFNAIYQVIKKIRGTYPDSAFSLAQAYYDHAAFVNNEDEMSKALNFQGNARNYQHRYEEAISYYLQSLALRRTINDYEGIANSCINLGAIYQELDDNARAMSYYDETIRLSGLHGFPDAEADAVNNIGSMYYYLGDYPMALEHFARALEIRKQMNDYSKIGSIINNIGIIYRRQGNIEKALEFALEGLRINREIVKDSSRVATSLFSIANIYADKSDYATCLRFYNQCLAIREQLADKKGIAFCQTNIANVYAKSGQEQKALEYFDRALAFHLSVKDYDKCASIYINVGGLYYDRKDYETAAVYHKKACETLNLIGYGPFSKMAHKNLYRCYVQMQQWSPALYCLSKVRELRDKELRTNYFIMTEQEKELYFATMESDYGLYYDFTMVRQDSLPALADTAYNIALMTKGLTLKSSTAMRTAILNSGDSTLISDYKTWLLLRQKISKQFSKGADTKELEAQAEEIEKELVNRSAAFRDFDLLEKLDWKTVQRSLQHGECAIEFVHYTEDINASGDIVYAALLVEPGQDHPRMIRLCTESALIEIIGKLRGNNLSFVNAVYGTRHEAKTALYHAIWQPLEPYLSEEIRTIYYSPSGLLHQVSLPALTKSQNVFLCDQHDFRQMSSTGKLTLYEEVDLDPDESFLVMGGVAYTTDSSAYEQWSYLPGSLDETNRISSFLEQKKFDVLYFSSGLASEETFKEKITASSMIHIATHGFFLSRS